MNARPLSALLPVLLAACPAPRDQPAADSTSPAVAVACTPDTATVVDSTLRIPLKNCGTSEFVSTPNAPEAGQWFTYVGHLERVPFHAVQARYYEAVGVFLVHDSTGRRIGVYEVPAVSPSGRLLAIASLDLHQIVRDNSIVIARVDGDSIVEEWKVAPQDWGPKDASWSGEDTVLFTRVWGIGERRSVPESPAMVVRTATGWVVQGEVPDTLPEDTTEVH